MNILLRIHSHRAYDKFKKLSILHNSLSSFTDGYYYEIDSTDLERAIKIKGIKKARKPKSQLLMCWNFKEQLRSEFEMP